MTLYDIERQIEDLLTTGTDEETGEITEDTLAALEQLSIDRDVKYENMICFIKNIAAESEAIKNEERNLSERRKRLDKKAGQIKQLLSNSLLANGLKRFDAPRGSASFRASTQVQILDEDALRREAIRTGHANWLVCVDPAISKTEIRKDIENGVTVVSAQIVQLQNIQIK